MMADVDKDYFVNDNVPALSPDVLMAAVVRLLPFTDALVPKLRVFAITKLLNLITYISLFRKLYISMCFHKIVISEYSDVVENLLATVLFCVSPEVDSLGIRSKKELCQFKEIIKKNTCQYTQRYFL